MRNFTFQQLPWPMGFRRTSRENIQPSNFKPRTLGEAAREAAHQARLLGGKDIVISVGFTPQNYHLDEYKGFPVEDQSVVLRIRFGDELSAFPCDRWKHIPENLWAIQSFLKTTRYQINWGVGELEHSFAGFKALPERTDSVDCYGVLGVTPTASETEIQAAFRRHALVLHPDRGGSNAAMAELINARDQALAQLLSQ
jgi:hypothetical protein